MDACETRPPSTSSLEALQSPPSSVVVHIQAELSDGTCKATFKVKQSAPLWKTWLLWCRKYGCDVDNVIFTAQGKVIEASETPQSCGWSKLAAAEGSEFSEVTVLATPRPGAEDLWPRCTPSPGSAAAASGCKIPSKWRGMAEAALPVALTIAAPLEGGSGSSESLSLASALAPDKDLDLDATPKEQVLNFRMARETPVRKLLAAWCRHHDVDPSTVVLRLGERELGMHETLDEFSGTMPLRIVALRAETASPEAPRIPATGSAAAVPLNPATGAPGAAPAPQRVKVQVEAEGDLKTTLEVVQRGKEAQAGLSLYAKVEALLGKVMTKWCRHHSLKVEDVIFKFQDRELMQDETALTCGWSAGDTIVLIASYRKRPLDEPRPPPPPKRGDSIAGAAPVAAMLSRRGSANFDDDEEAQREKALAEGKPDWRFTVRTQAVLLQEGQSITDISEMPPPDGAAAGFNFDVVDFKMRASMTFGRMMCKWQQYHKLTGCSEVRFLHEGVELRPTDTAWSLGWTAAEGAVLPIQVTVPAREASASSCPPSSGPGCQQVSQSQTLQADEQHQQPPQSQQPPVPEQRSSSPGDAQSEAPAEEKVKVQVIAQGGDGENIVDFTMKVSTQFDKMMRAWCTHQELSEHEAVFMFGEHLLQPHDSPLSCGWNAAKGALIIRAVPRDEEEDADEPMDKAEPAAAAPPPIQAAEGRPAEQPHPLSAEAATGSGKGGRGNKTAASQPPAGGGGPGVTAKERVQVKVIAEDASQEENVMVFQMLPTTPLGKMMKNWCEHHEVDLREASFLLGDREIRDDDTALSCGWSPGQEGLTLRAVPREDAEGETQPGEVAASASSSSAVASSALIAPPSVPTSTAAKAAGGGAARSDVADVAATIPATQPAFGGQNVEEDATVPATQVAVPPTQAYADAQPPDARACEPAAPCGHAGGSSGSDSLGDSCNQLVARLPSVGGNASAEEKITLSVIAEGSDGQTVLNFKMKAQSPLEKAMAAWCAHYQIQRRDASFFFGQRELDAQDTPLDLGWAPGNTAVLELHALPREATAEAAAPSMPAAKTAAAASATDPAAAPPQAASEPAAIETVNVQVVAEGSDGEYTLPFKMKLNTQFGKMMARWSQHHKIPQEEAAFLYGQRELKPEETPKDLGYRGGQDVVIQAVPRDSLPAAAVGGKKERKKNNSAAAPKPKAKGKAKAKAAAGEPGSPSGKQPRGRRAKAAAGADDAVLPPPPPPLGAAGDNVAAGDAFDGAAALPVVGGMNTSLGGPEAADFPASTPAKRTMPAAKRKPQATEKKAPKRKASKKQFDEEGQDELGGGNGRDGGPGAWSGDDDDAAAEGSRRSARLKMAHSSIDRRERFRPGVDMLVHYPPAPMSVRKRKAVDSIAAEEEQGEARTPIKAKMTMGSSDHMSYKEYLQFDREETRRIARAKEARARAKQINGGAANEEEAVAMALSISLIDSSPSSSPAHPSAALASGSEGRRDLESQ